MKITHLLLLLKQRILTGGSKSDNKQEDLMRFGREQFKKLLEKGLSVPVVLL